MSKQPRARAWWRGRFIRLSVRAMMALTLVVGAGLGWVVHRAWLRREAVDVIVRAGGHVTYEDDWSRRGLWGLAPESGTVPRIRDWIARHLGDE